LVDARARTTHLRTPSVLEHSVHQRCSVRGGWRGARLEKNAGQGHESVRSL